MTNNLKDFIRQVRDCQTTAEERAIVAKECAIIRTSLKENSNDHSFRKMAKLLFIHMMGYPISFAQMECLRLIASNNFEEKRIGYLAIHQLMKEDDEILMLVTNSIKSDLNHAVSDEAFLKKKNRLTALANIGSSQMILMLAHEVEELCFSPNVAIKRKAVVCALRIIKKVEDLNERFIGILPTLMHEQDHGVVMVTSCIISTLAQQDKTLVTPLKSQILSYLVLRLKTLVSTTGYANTCETEVGGVINPFLQVKLLQAILELLKIISPHSSCDTEINNLITQIIVITNSSRNPGCSILLECIKIISVLPYNKNLLDVCENVFSKLLQHKDSNIRYVGLCCIYQLVKQYPEVFESNTSIIMDCLNDSDNSIQRQALKIIYATMNTTTLRLYLNELIKLYIKKPLGILTFEDRELYNDLAYKIVMAILQFSPTKRYAMDALFYLLSQLKDLQLTKTETLLIELISTTPQLQSYATMKLFFLSKQRLTQTMLLNVCLWCLGEYGHLIIQPFNTSLDTFTITSHEIVNFLKEYLDFYLSSLTDFGKQNINLEETSFFIGDTALMTYASMTEQVQDSSYKILEIILDTLAKLCQRFPNEKHTLNLLIQKFTNHSNIEIQQRALEYSSLIDLNKEDLYSTIFDVIPALTKNCSNDLCSLNEKPVGNTTFNTFSFETQFEEILLKNPNSVQKTAMDTTDLLLLNDDEETISKLDNKTLQKDTKFASVIDLLDDLPLPSSPNSLL